MTLILELPEDMERQLSEQAHRRRRAPEEYAKELLLGGLAAAAVEQDLRSPEQIVADTLARVGRRTPAELSALARQQGVEPTRDPKKLVGVWVDDGEAPFDVDAFLEARRNWCPAETDSPLSDEQIDLGSVL